MVGPELDHALVELPSARRLAEERGVEQVPHHVVVAVPRAEDVAAG